MQKLLLYYQVLLLRMPVQLLLLLSLPEQVYQLLLLYSLLRQPEYQPVLPYKMPCKHL